MVKRNTGIADSKLAQDKAALRTIGTGGWLMGISGRILAINQKRLYLVTPLPKPYCMPNAMTKADSSAITLIASGLTDRFSIDPLVALYSDPQMKHSYHLLIHIYIPDGPVPVLSSDFNTIQTRKTDAGELALRLISIAYDHPASEARSFSLWKVNVIYTVEGAGAEALWVRLITPEISDPDTARGTVTSVATT